MTYTRLIIIIKLTERKKYNFFFTCLKDETVTTKIIRNFRHLMSTFVPITCEKTSGTINSNHPLFHDLHELLTNFKAVILINPAR